MGRLTGTLEPLEAADFDIETTAELFRRTLEALKGSSDLPISSVKVPAGGARAFELPGGDGPMYVTELEGVILCARFVNAYWESAFGQGDTAPQCSSQDGISGWDAQGNEHVCAACPRNRMGSKDGGRGKACRNMAHLLIALPKVPLPVAMRIPPTSLPNYQRYVAGQLVPRGLAPWQVVTGFTLAQASSSTGIAYAQVCFKAKGTVNADALRGSFAPALPDGA